jgi:hypothetical protein
LAAYDNTDELPADQLYDSYNAACLEMVDLILVEERGCWNIISKALMRCAEAVEKDDF